MLNKPLVLLCLASLLAACKPAAEPVATPVAVEPAPPAAVEATVTSLNFQCGDERIGAAFDNAAGNVTLTIGGQPMTLLQAESASGARYADGQGNEFWNKGDSATLTRSGQPAAECAQTQLTSPWDEAKGRGVGFRAVGNEPGWMVEVDTGEAPALRATLDSGAREIAVARAQSQAAGFAGTTNDGVAVELQIRRETCSDTMSGQEFPASAQLKVGEQTYAGCGRFLFD